MTKPLLIIGNKNYSSWSLRGWLALTMAGIDFDEKIIPLFESDHADTMARETTAGKVPVLIDGDATIWESLAIAEYAAELNPDAGLWPADAGLRAEARSISCEMISGFTGLRNQFHMNCRRRIEGITPSEAATADITRIQHIWRDCRNKYSDNEAGEAGEAGGDFLFGAFSIADVMYAPVVFRFENYFIDVDPICRAYMTAILSLPAIQAWKAAAEAEPWVIEEEEL